MCYTAGLLSPFAAIAGYKLNKEKIASSLCENKSDPASDCEGHCYLQKELAKDIPAPSDTKRPGSRQLTLSLLSPHCMQSPELPGLDYVLLKNKHQEQPCMSLHDHVAQIFNPPDRQLTS